MCLACCTKALPWTPVEVKHAADICRYPPVIDPKMEEAAEALQAIMQDLAAQKSQPEAPALPSAEQPPAADPDGLHGDEGAVQAAMDTDGKPGGGLGSCAAETVVADRVQAGVSHFD